MFEQLNALVNKYDSNKYRDRFAIVKGNTNLQDMVLFDCYEKGKVIAANCYITSESFHNEYK